MLPHSKFLRIALISVPLILGALLWNAARGRPRFVATPVPVQALALSHDGKRLAFSIQNDEVFWGQNGSYQRLPLEYSPGFGVKSPAALQFSRDGNALVGTGVRLLANKTPAACQWDLRSNRLVWSVTTAQNDDLASLALSSDGKSLAQRSGDVVKVMDLTTTGRALTNSKSRYERAFSTLLRQKIQRTDVTGRGDFISGIALSADGAILIIAENYNGGSQFWNVATGQRIGQTPPIPLPPASLLIAESYDKIKPSPDGRFVAMCNNIEVALWDTTTKSWTRSAQTSSAPRDIAWMPDSRSLWTSGFVAPNSDADKVQQLSAPDLKPLRTLPTWGPFAISGDGHILATRDNAQKGVWLWNIE